MNSLQGGGKVGMVIESPRDGLYSLRHKALKNDLMFFTNTYRRESVTSRVDCWLGDRGLWRWDPETGEREPYDHPYDARGFTIDLRPLESVLLVTGEKQPPSEPRPVGGGGSAVMTISGPWSVAFQPARKGDVFTVEMKSLSEFTRSKDRRLRTFSGTATYSTQFTLKNNDGFRWFDLGWDNDFISEIEINGQPVGVNWYGSRLFDVEKALRKGENNLVIRYTTTLFNSMPGKKPRPSGLLGPVRLLERRGTR